MRRLLFLLLFMVLICQAQSQVLPDSSIRNLVFEGAGIRGIAYAGALQELEKTSVISGVQRTGGNSAGALIAALIATGYNAAEITALIEKTNMRKLADGGGLFPGGMHRMKNNYGYYKGEKLRGLVGELINAKTGKEDLTFRELHQLHLQNPAYKDLYITGTNVSRQCLTVFSHETFPEMEIRNAVRISVSIPVFFAAVRMNDSGEVLSGKSTEPHSIMIDGGLHANYPVFLFDRRKFLYDHSLKPLFPATDTTYTFNYQTLGLKMDSREQIEYDLKNQGLSPYKVDDLAGFVSAFYTLVIENLNRPGMVAADIDRTVYIDVAHIGPRVRKMKPAQLQTLFSSGRDGVAQFYQRKKP
jgi:NTE family protein